MNITELQTLLHEHAEHVDDQGAGVRGSQMQHRIVVAKRRRTAGAVAALAVVLAGTAAGLAGLPGGDDNSAPVTPQDGPVYTPSEAGRELIDSVVSREGAGEARFDTTLDTNHVLLSAECFSDAPGLWYEVRVNGEYAEGGGCLPGPAPEELGASGTQGTPGEPGPWAGLTKEGGQFEVDVVTTRGDGGPRVSDPSTRLVAAVYRLPDAIATLAGYELYEREVFEGREWQLESYDESAPGARRRESSIEGAGPDRLALVYVESFRGMARISANGQLQTTLGSGGGTRIIVTAEGGQRSVQVRLSQETQGTIGIAWYAPVDE